MELNIMNDSEEFQTDIVHHSCADLLPKFEKACIRRDINDADKLWHQMSENYIVAVIDWAGYKIDRNKLLKIRRGEAPTFEELPVMAPSSRVIELGASTAQLRAFVNMIDKETKLRLIFISAILV
mgnify:CR=1 FL=1